MLFKFADFLFEFKNTLPYFDRKCVGYEIADQNLNATFEITEKDVDSEMEFAETGVNRNNGYFSAGLRYLAEWLPLNDAFVLHSACFDVDGVGVAFAAHSGTGKTTHMRLWQELLGERMTVVNGDKPIVRFFDEKSDRDQGAAVRDWETKNYPFAYGTPWNGKEHLGCNMKTELQHICFIERAAENSCEKMEKQEAIDLLFNQVYMPKDPQAAFNTMQLIDRLISSCSLWKIRCNMDISAAETSYNAIFGE